MKIVIDIRRDNAAFEENDNELFEILSDAVERINDGEFRQGILKDSNGNTVGKFKVTGK